MAKTLAEKIKESRQIEVKVGEITFFANRATIEETFKYASEMTRDADIARRHVTGWDGVKESDVLEGGSSEIVPFDKDIFDYAISDNQEWWTFIAQGVTSKSFERINKKAEAQKK